MNESAWLKCNDPAAMVMDLATWHELTPDRPKLSDRKLRLFACACCRQLKLLNDASLQAIEKAEGDGKVIRTWRGKGTGGLITPVFSLYRTDATDCAWAVLNDPLIQRSAERATLASLLRCIVGNPWQKLGYFWWDGKLYPSVGGMADVRHADGKRVLSVDDKNIPVPWLTPLVSSLAEAAYYCRTEPAWSCRCGAPLDGSHDHDKCGPPILEAAGGLLENDRLLVLSDALEEAGLVEPCPRCEGHGQVAVVAGCADRWLPDEDGVPFKRLRTSCPDCKKTGTAPHGLLAHLRSPGPHVRGCWALDLILGKE